MKTSLAMLALLAAAPALAVPGGRIGTLNQGHYICELPGDAAGPAGIRQADKAFDVLNYSSYSTSRGRGTYLLVGDTLTFTSGPRKGERFHRVSSNFLRQIGPDGKDANLRCVRQVVNNR